MGTGILIALATTTTAVAGVSTQRQVQTGRRAETRQKSIIAQEETRQAKQSNLIATQESNVAKKIGGRLKATAGKRSGRRSLITGAETGVDSQTQLGQQQQLG